jgi:hypothetical protein
MDTAVPDLKGKLKWVAVFAEVLHLKIESFFLITVYRGGLSFHDP